MLLEGWSTGSGESWDFSVVNISVLKDLHVIFQNKSQSACMLKNKKNHSILHCLCHMPKCSCLLISLYKDCFWNTGYKSLPCSAASYRVSSAGLWKETKLPVRAECLLFSNQTFTLSLYKRILRSQVYSARLGKAAHLYSLGAEFFFS